MSSEEFLRHALQDLVEIVVQDVETQSDRLVEALKHAKGVLAMYGREGAQGHERPFSRFTLP